MADKLAPSSVFFLIDLPSRSVGFEGKSQNFPHFLQSLSYLNNSMSCQVSDSIFYSLPLLRVVVVIIIIISSSSPVIYPTFVVLALFCGKTFLCFPSVVYENMESMTVFHANSKGKRWVSEKYNHPTGPAPRNRRLIEMLSGKLFGAGIMEYGWLNCMPSNIIILTISNKNEILLHQSFLYVPRFHILDLCCWQVQFTHRFRFTSHICTCLNT